MKTITLEEIIKQYLQNLGIDVSDISNTETNYNNLSIIVDVEDENLSLGKIKDSAQFAYGLTIFDSEYNCTRGRIFDAQVTIELYTEASIMIEFTTI